MNLLFDFLPLILFFGAFKYTESHAASAAQFATEHFGFLVSGGVVGATDAPVLIATLVVAIATLVQVTLRVVRGQRVGPMLWSTFGLVVVLGGATIWFHNATFIMWKPTVLYWAMAIGLWISQSMFGKNLLQATIGAQIALPQPAWRKLNVAWIAFFTLLGFVNLYVAYHYSTSTWASFKVFGITGLMFVFVLAQGVFIARHAEPVPAAAAPGQPGLEPAPASSRRRHRPCARTGRERRRPARARRLGQRHRHRGCAAGRAGALAARGRRRQPPACGACGRARRQPLSGPHREWALRRIDAGRAASPRI